MYLPIILLNLGKEKINLICFYFKFPNYDEPVQVHLNVKMSMSTKGETQGQRQYQVQGWKSDKEDGHKSVKR